MHFSQLPKIVKIQYIQSGAGFFKGTKFKILLAYKNSNFNNSNIPFLTILSHAASTRSVDDILVAFSLVQVLHGFPAEEDG